MLRACGYLEASVRTKAIDLVIDVSVTDLGSDTGVPGYSKQVLKSTAVLKSLFLIENPAAESEGRVTAEARVIDGHNFVTSVTC